MTLDEFIASMPAIYRQAHDDEAIAEHARISAERGARTANVGLLSSDEGALCVVADDRPGVLASMSAALMLEGLDVVDAEAHTRRIARGRDEAVDIFWVQRAKPEDRTRPLTAADVDSLRDTLCALLEGRLERSSVQSARGRARGETVVRFVEDADGVLATLEVETDDQSGLLLALSQALFDQKVQIAESEVRTIDGRVYDRFRICETDGSPISTGRRLEIQIAVLVAIQPG
jgi:[protein-PII] uridylyltransferase